MSESPVIKLTRKWWPPAPDREEWSAKLRRFYDENSAYHAMTAEARNPENPQVKLLLCLLDAGKSYVEVGCGSGEICGYVSGVARTRGFDISPIAIENAQRCYGGPTARFEVASAESLPVPDSSVDGVYSFEVLEHLWNPCAALCEMARIVKPGGYILVSTPNYLSLDLHLRKHAAVRFVEGICAGARYIHDMLTGRSYVTLVPDIEGADVYSDCDMVSSLVPCNMPRTIREMGCELVFVDTFYMGAHDPSHDTDLAFQRNAGRPVVKWFGDHILLLAVKERQA
ncbi:MAG: class I SAM-dependent methyltransferase [Lentisphaerae bacterium]|nr:class I SAM-dependent methyltransferase [Lentisphaerota bacterium]